MLVHDSLNWRSKFGTTLPPEKPSNFTCFYIQKYEGIIPVGSLDCPGVIKEDKYPKECIKCEYFKKGANNNGKNIT